MVPSEVLVNGEIVAISNNTVHLGHTICTKDCEDITFTAKNHFWKYFCWLEEIIVVFMVYLSQDTL